MAACRNKHTKMLGLWTPPPRKQFGPLTRWPSANTASQSGDLWPTHIDFQPNTPCSLAWLVAGRNMCGCGSLWYRTVQWDRLWYRTGCVVSRARICKRLRSPGIDSEESIPPTYVTWRAGATNRVCAPVRQAKESIPGLLKKVYKYWLCSLFSYTGPASCPAYLQL